MSKMLPIYCLTSDKCQSSQILPTQQNREPAPIPSKIYIHLLVDLGQMAAILDVSYGMQSVKNSDNTTMLSIPENRMISTEKMNIPLLCRKLYKFTIYSLAKVGHLGFYPQRNVISDHTIVSGISKNPIVGDKIRHLLLFCGKLHQFNVWPWPLMAAMLNVLLTMQCPKYFVAT